MTQLPRIDHATDPAAWDRAIAREGGTVFHTTAWARYVAAETAGARPLFVTWPADGDTSTGRALAFQMRSPAPLLRALSGRVWLDTPPLVQHADPASRRRALEDLETAARRLRAVELLVGSFAAPPIQDDLLELGFTVHGRFEFEIDLCEPDDRLLSAMEPQRRNKIRKAGRSGVEIRPLKGYEGLAELRRVQQESARRIARRGGPALDLPDAQNDRDPARVLLDAGVARLVGAFVDGACVSASLFTCFNGVVYHALSGHAGGALKTQAPTLVIWETMRQCREDGFTRFNLGGCSAAAQDESSPEHGVYVYKKGFGGRVRNCASGRRVLRPLVYRLRRLVGRT